MRGRSSVGLPVSEAATKRKRGRPPGSRVPLSRHPDRQVVALLAALEAIASLTGTPTTRRGAAADGVLFAKQCAVTVELENSSNKTITGAKHRPARAEFGVRRKGKLRFKYNGHSGPVISEAAADRARKIWEAVQPPPDPDGAWLDLARVAWMVVLAPKLARNYFDRDLVALFTECVQRTDGQEFWEKQAAWIEALDTSLGFSDPG